MPDVESSRIPYWAEQERDGDLAWIAENAHIFLPAAKQGYETHARGALVVDTTQRPTGEGHPFGYFPQEMLEQSDEDTRRLVREYAPEDDEFDESDEEEELTPDDERE